MPSTEVFPNSHSFIPKTKPIVFYMKEHMATRPVDYTYCLAALYISSSKQKRGPQSQLDVQQVPLSL